MTLLQLSEQVWRQGFRFALALVASCCASQVLAQTYPAQSVRLIVPYPAGAGIDIVARMLAPQLSENLGQSVVIENRAGAGAAIGMTTVARAQADGYTLGLVDAGPLVINPALNAQLPYSVAEDFVPVVFVASLPTMLVVHPSLPVASLAEFLALARQRPGQVHYASAGMGTLTHLAMELVQSQAQVTLLHVPYSGTAPALAGVLAGDPVVLFTNLLSGAPLVAQGKLRALAIASPKRTPALPNLPTLAEAGLPDFDLQSWFGVVAPKATPQSIVERVNLAFRVVLALPDIKARLMSQGGMEAGGGSVAEFRTLLERETALYKRLVQQVSVKPAGS